MADNETPQIKTNHDTAIALMGRDVQYVREAIGKIETAITMMDRNYTRRDEFTSMVGLIKEIGVKLEKKADHEDIKKINDALKEKVNHTEFDPIQKSLSKANWLLIAGVITAIMSIIVNSSK